MKTRQNFPYRLGATKAHIPIGYATEEQQRLYGK